MILLAAGSLVATGGLMLLLLSAEDMGVSLWAGLGVLAFAALLVAGGIAELRDRRDDWPR